MNRAEELIHLARTVQASWAQLTVQDRLKFVESFKEQILEHLDEIVQAIHEDIKKVRVDILGGDVLVTLEALRYYQKYARGLLKKQKVNCGGMLFWDTSSHIEHYPYGVVVVLGPWNYPFQLSLLPALGALIAGNCVVLKMSEYCPQLFTVCQKLLKKCQFPEGVFQIVEGSRELGQALVKAAPDKVFLTGSSETGKKVLLDAAQNLTPALLELGGKDAMIVFDDAPLPRAASAAVYGAFSNAGQVCVATKRLFIQNKIYDKFLQNFTEQAAKLKVGVASDSDYGPMLRAEEVTRLNSQVQSALSAGAKLLTPLKIEGNSVRPVVIADLPESHALWDEENFSPLVLVRRFESENDAIQAANNSSFGLGASVFTLDNERASRVASRLVVGLVIVNDVIRHVGHPSAPFGGEKHSGFGRYHGRDGLLAFSRKRVVHVTKSRKEKEINWFPIAGNTYSLLIKVIRFRYGSKNVLSRLMPVLLVMLGSVNSANSEQGTLKVRVTHIPSSQGKLAYALFTNPKAFPSKKEEAHVKGFKSIPENLELSFNIEKLNYGVYALAIFHDANSNEKLDKNFLGVPLESIGNSNNPKIFMGPPSFDSARFEVNQENNEVLIRMLR